MRVRRTLMLYNDIDITVAFTFLVTKGHRNKTRVNFLDKTVRRQFQRRQIATYS